MLCSYSYLTHYTPLCNLPYVRRGGVPDPAPYLSPLPAFVYPHRIIRPPGRHLSQSHHIKAHRSMYQTPLPPCLPRPCLSFRITNASPLPLPEYLLTSHSAASYLPFAATTSHCAFSLPCSPSSCCKYPALVSTPPTPPLSPYACQCTPPVSGSPLPLSPLPNYYSILRNTFK